MIAPATSLERAPVSVDFTAPRVSHSYYFMALRLVRKGYSQCPAPALDPQTTMARNSVYRCPMRQLQDQCLPVPPFNRLKLPVIGTMSCIPVTYYQFRPWMRDTQKIEAHVSSGKLFTSLRTKELMCLWQPFYSLLAVDRSSLPWIHCLIRCKIAMIVFSKYIPPTCAEQHRGELTAMPH